MQSLDARELLADIFALHICPKLEVADLQRLSQSCATLRRVSRSLPDRVWRCVAENTYPRSHPIMRVDSCSILADLESLAASRAAVLRGQMVADNLPHVWTNCNHAATQLITGKNDEELQLWDIDPANKQQTRNWAGKRPSIEGEWESAHDGYVWSEDDKLIAIRHSGRSDEDERSRYNANGHFDIVWVVDTTTRTVDEATNSIKTNDTYAHVELVAFAPHTRMLLVQWDHNAAGSDGFFIDVYQPGGSWELLVRVHDPCAQYLTRSSTAFHPSGQSFALARPHCVSVFPFDGGDAYDLPVGPLDSDFDMCTVSWSATGSRVLYWQADKIVATLHVYDDATHALISSHAIAVVDFQLPPTQCLTGPKWYPRCLLASYNSLACVYCEVVAYRHKNFKVLLCNLADGKVGQLLAVIDARCEPVFSLEGAFLAVIADISNSAVALRIYDTRTGSCVLELGHAQWGQDMCSISTIGIESFQLQWSWTGIFVSCSSNSWLIRFVDS